MIYADGTHIYFGNPYSAWCGHFGRILSYHAGANMYIVALDIGLRVEAAPNEIVEA